MTPTRQVGVAQVALDLARVFASGGRLAVTAPGRPDHARHVAVEFVHPAITGARSLPAFASEAQNLAQSVLPTDAVLIIESDDHEFGHAMPTSALVISPDPGKSGSALVRWYHVLWELVQLGLEHPGLVGGAASSGGDSTNFLYPFLDAAEHDEPALLASMAASAEAKELESETLAAQTLVANADTIDAIAAAVTVCNKSDGTVFTIGNGGSACDASRLVRRLRACGIRATSLADDPATLTALANDLGVAHVFARQVEASLRPTDMLVAFSTSGASKNLLTAFDSRTAEDATLVACAGYGGGALAGHKNVDYRVVVDSTSVHRIQEAQAAVIATICERALSLGGPQ